jgi:hypothetical protein
MESLALLVAIILAVSLFSGPIALFLTWLPILNRESTSRIARLIRRIFVTFLSIIGSLMSFNLFIASVGLAATFMAFVGSLTAFFAVKREYFPNGFGIKKFGGGTDRRNGPGGQH